MSVVEASWSCKHNGMSSQREMASVSGVWVVDWNHGNRGSHMSTVQNAGGAVDAGNLIAELRRIVQAIPPIFIHPEDDESDYKVLEVEVISHWLDKCMQFGRELARTEHIKFVSRVPRMPAEFDSFVRYLGASDAWLGALQSALQSGAVQPGSEAKGAPERQVEQLQRLRDLVAQLEQMINDVPLNLRLEGEPESGEPSLVIRWTLSCATFVADRLAERGIRSGMDLPQWGKDAERSMGAVDTWLNMLQEAVEGHLRPVAA